MRTWKKPVKLAIALTLPLSLALAACGSSSETSGNGQSSGTSGDEQTLTVWAWDPTFNILAMQEAEKIYQKDHPDFKLNIVETPWEDLQTKITTLAQSQELSELPDIFLVQNNALQKNLTNFPEIFDPLTDSGIDFSEFPTAVVSYSVMDEQNWGVPFDSGTAFSAYRIDVLEEAGYSITDFEGITWDEFITKGTDVLNKTSKPLLSGQAGSPDTIMMMLQSAGASLFDTDGNPTIVDNPALDKAIEYYSAMVNAGIYREVNNWDEYIATFVNGEVASVMNGVWIVGSMQSAADQSGLWEITNVPSLSGISGATNYSANGGSSWVVSSNANTELAYDFLATTFAGSTELYDVILPESGAVGNWIPAGSSQVYKEPQPFFNNRPVYETVVEFSEDVPPNNTGPYYYEARDAIGVALTNIMSGTDVKSALQEAQQTVEFAMQ